MSGATVHTLRDFLIPNDEDTRSFLEEVDETEGQSIAHTRSQEQVSRASGPGAAILPLTLNDVLEPLREQCTEQTFQFNYEGASTTGPLRSGQKHLSCPDRTESRTAHAIRSSGLRVQLPDRR